MCTSSHSKGEALSLVTKVKFKTLANSCLVCACCTKRRRLEHALLLLCDVQLKKRSCDHQHRSPPMFTGVHRMFSDIHLIECSPVANATTNSCPAGHSRMYTGCCSEGSWREPGVSILPIQYGSRSELQGVPQPRQLSVLEFTVGKLLRHLCRAVTEQVPVPVRARPSMPVCTRGSFNLRTCL